MTRHNHSPFYQSAFLYSMTAIVENLKTVRDQLKAIRGTFHVEGTNHSELEERIIACKVLQDALNAASANVQAIANFTQLEQSNYEQET